MLSVHFLHVVTIRASDVSVKDFISITKEKVLCNRDGHYLTIFKTYRAFFPLCVSYSYRKTPSRVLSKVLLFVIISSLLQPFFRFSTRGIRISNSLMSKNGVEAKTVKPAKH